MNTTSKQELLDLVHKFYEKLLKVLNPSNTNDKIPTIPINALKDYEEKVLPYDSNNPPVINTKFSEEEIKELSKKVTTNHTPLFNQIKERICEITNRNLTEVSRCVIKIIKSEQSILYNYTFILDDNYKYNGIHVTIKRNKYSYNDVTVINESVVNSLKEFEELLDRLDIDKKYKSKEEVLRDKIIEYINTLNYETKIEEHNDATLITKIYNIINDEPLDPRYYNFFISKRNTKLGIHVYIHHGIYKDNMFKNDNKIFSGYINEIEEMEQLFNLLKIN